MSWTVVIFEETDNEPELVQVVPTNWIDGDCCFWPTFPPDKLKSSIKKCAEKDEKWPSFKIRILRNSTYDNYGLALKKGKRAELTSDLTTDQEESQRISKPNKYYHLSDSDSESEIEVTKKQRAFKKVTKPTAPLGNSIFLNNDATCSRDNFEILRNKDNFQELDSTRSNVDVTRKKIEETEQNTQSLCCKSCPSSKYKKELFVVTQLLLELNEKMDNLLKTNTLKQNDDEKEDKELLKKILLTLPVTSEEDFDKFELILKEQQNYKVLINNFARKGGGSYIELIRRVLSSLITDDIAKKYSYLGRKGKIPFKELKTNNLVIEAVEKSGANATKKQIEDAIAAWLKRATERQKRALEKKN